MAVGKLLTVVVALLVQACASLPHCVVPSPFLLSSLLLHFSPPRAVSAEFERRAHTQQPHDAL